MIWAPRVTVAALVCYQEKYLLVEEACDGVVVYNQPAGHLERGESIVAAVIRETHEETGGQLQPSHLVGIYRWQHPDKDLTYLRFCIAGVLNEPHGELIPRDKDIRRTLWLDYEEIKKAKNLRSPLVLRCIEDFRQGHRYPLELCRDIV